jgi:hypothetical protein
LDDPVAPKICYTFHLNAFATGGIIVSDISGVSSENGLIQDDRIFISTRIVSAIVVPFLVLAFLVLYLTPDRSGEHFAWEIKPAMTAAFMGAGYLGGAWVFLNAIFGRRWHRVVAGFLPVTTFTIFMLLVTIVHWKRFDPNHVPFLLWLGLYVITPILVPLLWWRNRVTDPGIPESNDQVVPRLARWALRLLGLGLVVFALAGFIFPEWVIGLWPWMLTPLTARIMSGWFALLGVGGLVIANESRWSGWRVGLQSIGLWHLLVVVAAVAHPSDFSGGLGNWYLISVVLVLLGMLALYLAMEIAHVGQPTGQPPGDNG